MSEQASNLPAGLELGPSFRDVTSELRQEYEKNNQLIDLTEAEPEDLKAQAEDVLSTLKSVYSLDRRKNEMTAKEAYVEGESQPDMKQLASLLVDARKFFQASLATERARARGDRIDPKVSDMIHVYHYDLVEWMDKNISKVGISQLTQWMSRASEQGARAEGIVLGAAGEVAIKKLLRDIEPATRYARPQEDAKGKDIITFANYDGKFFQVGIDVKTLRGLGRAELLRVLYTSKNGHILHVRYGVDANDIGENGEIKPEHKLEHYARLHQLLLSDREKELV